ncbi:hypothetical protein ACOMHN_040248 [Nucella lapillus]
MPVSDDVNDVDGDIIRVDSSPDKTFVGKYPKDGNVEYVFVIVVKKPTKIGPTDGNVYKPTKKDKGIIEDYVTELVIISKEDKIPKVIFCAKFTTGPIETTCPYEMVPKVPEGSEKYEGNEPGTTIVVLPFPEKVFVEKVEDVPQGDIFTIVDEPYVVLQPNEKVLVKITLPEGATLPTQSTAELPGTTSSQGATVTQGPEEQLTPKELVDSSPDKTFVGKYPKDGNVEYVFVIVVKKPTKIGPTDGNVYKPTKKDKGIIEDYVTELVIISKEDKIPKVIFCAKFTTASTPETTEVPTVSTGIPTGTPSTLPTRTTGPIETTCPYEMVPKVPEGSEKYEGNEPGTTIVVLPFPEKVFVEKVEDVPQGDIFTIVDEPYVVLQPNEKVLVKITLPEGATLPTQSTAELPGTTSSQGATGTQVDSSPDKTFVGKYPKDGNVEYVFVIVVKKPTKIGPTDGNVYKPTKKDKGIIEDYVTELVIISKEDKIPKVIFCAKFTTASTPETTEVPTVSTGIPTGTPSTLPTRTTGPIETTCPYEMVPKVPEGSEKYEGNEPGTTIVVLPFPEKVFVEKVEDVPQGDIFTIVDEPYVVLQPNEKVLVKITLPEGATLPTQSTAELPGTTSSQGATETQGPEEQLTPKELVDSSPDKTFVGKYPKDGNVEYVFVIVVKKPTKIGPTDGNVYKPTKKDKGIIEDYVTELVIISKEDKIPKVIFCAKFTTASTPETTEVPTVSTGIPTGTPSTLPTRTTGPIETTCPYEMVPKVPEGSEKYEGNEPGTTIVVLPFPEKVFVEKVEDVPQGDIFTIVDEPYVVLQPNEKVLVKITLPEGATLPTQSTAELPGTTSSQGATETQGPEEQLTPKELVDSSLDKTFVGKYPKDGNVEYVFVIVVKKPTKIGPTDGNVYKPTKKDKGIIEDYVTELVIISKEDKIPKVIFCAKFTTASTPETTEVPTVSTGIPTGTPSTLPTKTTGPIETTCPYEMVPKVPEGSEKYEGNEPGTTIVVLPFPEKVFVEKVEDVPQGDIFTIVDEPYVVLQPNEKGLVKITLPEGATLPTQSTAELPGTTSSQGATGTQGPEEQLTPKELVDSSPDKTFVGKYPKDGNVEYVFVIVVKKPTKIGPTDGNVYKPTKKDKGIIEDYVTELVIISKEDKIPKVIFCAKFTTASTPETTEVPTVSTGIPTGTPSTLPTRTTGPIETTCPYEMVPKVPEGSEKYEGNEPGTTIVVLPFPEKVFVEKVEDVPQGDIFTIVDEPYVVLQPNEKVLVKITLPEGATLPTQSTAELPGTTSSQGATGTQVDSSPDKTFVGKYPKDGNVEYVFVIVVKKPTKIGPTDGNVYKPTKKDKGIIEDYVTELVIISKEDKIPKVIFCAKFTTGKKGAEQGRYLTIFYVRLLSRKYWFVFSQMSCMFA